MNCPTCKNPVMNPSPDCEWCGSVISQKQNSMMSSDNINPFEILGVNQNSTQKEIKNAYRALALKYHPDKKGGIEANKKFEEAVEAYNLLLRKFLKE